MFHKHQSSTFSDDSVFLKKILAGDINSLNLLVFSTAVIAWYTMFTASKTCRC